MSDKVENQMSAKRVVTHEMARAAFRKFHEYVYNHGPLPFLHIPPNDNDVDMVLGDYISQQATSSRAPARTSAIAALEAEWLSQDKILDYRNWLQDKLLQSRASHAHSEGAQQVGIREATVHAARELKADCPENQQYTNGWNAAMRLIRESLGAAHSEGVDTKELAELRAIVGRCEKTSAGILGGRCDRPKGHRGSHETRNGMTTWLGPNDEPELSEGVDGSKEKFERDKAKFSADLSAYAEMCEIANKPCDVNAFNAGWLARDKELTENE